MAFQMRWVFGIVVLLAVIAGGFALVSHMRDLNSAVAVTQRAVMATGKRLAEIERELEDLRAAQASRRAQQPLPLGDAGVLRVTPREAEMIREVILNQPGIAPGMAAVANVGQTLQDISPRSMPAELVSQIPKLRGLRYVLDAHWAIALIAASTNRVVAVISPV